MWVRDNRDVLLAGMRAVLAQPEPPRISLKNSCKECIYYSQMCSLGAPEHPVCELGGNHSGLFAALEAAGVADVRDVPEDFPGLADGHRLVLEAVRTGELALDTQGFSELSEDMVFPLWFLDFETYMFGVPVYAGTRPWQQIPFQWSLHVQEQDGSVRHAEFLKADGSDPRRDFARSTHRGGGSVGVGGGLQQRHGIHAAAGAGARSA